MKALGNSDVSIELQYMTYPSTVGSSRQVQANPPVGTPQQQPMAAVMTSASPMTASVRRFLFPMSPNFTPSSLGMPAGWNSTQLIVGTNAMVTTSDVPGTSASHSQPMTTHADALETYAPSVTQVQQAGGYAQGAPQL